MHVHQCVREREHARLRGAEVTTYDGWSWAPGPGAPEKKAVTGPLYSCDGCKRCHRSALLPLQQHKQHTAAFTHTLSPSQNLSDVPIKARGRSTCVVVAFFFPITSTASYVPGPGVADCKWRSEQCEWIGSGTDGGCSWCDYPCWHSISADVLAPKRVLGPA